MDELTEIGLKCDTDKAYWHKYTEFYQQHFNPFRYKHLNILEIGIQKGNSIRMLHEYFPNSIIYCIDIRDECVDNAKNIDRVKPYNCDQSKKQDLLKIANEAKNFDIIIDDGSHFPKHQIKSIDVLFPFLNNGGLYICEDIHTSIKMENYQSVIYYLKNYLHYKSAYISEEGHDYFKNNTKKINFYMRDSIPLKCWKCKTDIIDDIKKCSCGIAFLPNETDSMTCIIEKDRQ